MQKRQFRKAQERPKADMALRGFISLIPGNAINSLPRLLPLILVFHTLNTALPRKNLPALDSKNNTVVFSLMESQASHLHITSIESFSPRKIQ